jgi:hypothetical protein
LFTNSNKIKKVKKSKKKQRFFLRLEKHVYLCTTKKIRADSVAQQVEHIPFKDGVLGSNPSWITLKGWTVSSTFIFDFFRELFKGRFSSSAGRAHPF